MNDYVNANKSKMEIVNDISVFVIFSMVDKGIQQVASLFFVKITSSLINNLITTYLFMMVVSIESPNLSLKFILGSSPSTTKHDVVRASICCVTHPGMYKKSK